MFNAVILAGGGKGKDEELTRGEGVENKAFIDLHGRPMLAHILDALAEAPSIGEVAVVGPERELSSLLGKEKLFSTVAEEGGLLENVAAGLKTLDQQQPALVLTADIPLIDGAVIEGFLKLCAPFDGDFYYPILEREICQRHFPQMKRTYVRLREGRYTGGNMALLRPDWFARTRHRLDLFVAFRKKPLKLFRILPAGFIFKFIFKRLTVGDLESYLSEMLEAKARAVPCDFVEIGTDVDKTSDLEVVRQALRGR